MWMNYLLNIYQQFMNDLSTSIDDVYKIIYNSF